MVLTPRNTDSKLARMETALAKGKTLKRRRSSRKESYMMGKTDSSNNTSRDISSDRSPFREVARRKSSFRQSKILRSAPPA